MGGTGIHYQFFLTPFWVSQRKIIYFCSMYVRRKPNRLVSESVVVIEKANGKVCCLKTIGIGSNSNTIENFFV